MYGSSFGQAFEDARAFGWQVSNKAGAHWQHLAEVKVRPVHAWCIVHRPVADDDLHIAPLLHCRCISARPRAIAAILPHKPVRAAT